MIELLEAAVRNMRLDEFLSERFMEEVLTKSPILDKQKKKFREYRPRFAELIEKRNALVKFRADSKVDELITILRGSSPWMVGFNNDHAGFVLHEYVDLVLRRGHFSTEANKVLELM